VFFDALRVKIRDEGLVRNKAVYIALGVQADGKTVRKSPALGAIGRNPQLEPAPSESLMFFDPGRVALYREVG
jgi:hypothetical protein